MSKVDWSSMSAAEVWDALKSAPKVAGPWERHGLEWWRRTADGAVAFAVPAGDAYLVHDGRTMTDVEARCRRDAQERAAGWLLVDDPGPALKGPNMTPPDFNAQTNAQLQTEAERVVVAATHAGRMTPYEAALLRELAARAVRWEADYEEKAREYAAVSGELTSVAGAARGFLNATEPDVVAYRRDALRRAVEAYERAREGSPAAPPEMGTGEWRKEWCPVCGANPRTHACDEEACEPSTPERP